MFADIQRTVRVQDSLWQSFEAAAEAKGINATDALNQLLTGYISSGRNDSTAPQMRLDSTAQKLDAVARQAYIERLKQPQKSSESLATTSGKSDSDALDDGRKSYLERLKNPKR